LAKHEPHQAKRAGREGRARTSRRRGPSAALAVPGEDFEIRFGELDRDGLSVFLYVALTPAETALLVKDLGLQQPGFRQEGLGEVQRCDLLADEMRADPRARAAVLEELKKGWERPVLARWPLAPEAARDLLDACTGEGALPLALWRVLCDPSAPVRAEARPVLEQLVAFCYGPAGETDGPQGADSEASLHPENLGRKLAEATSRLAQAEGKAESLRKKSEEARQKLQGWLKEARAREAKAVAEAARAREQAVNARAEQARLQEELALAKAVEPAVEAQRLKGALRESTARVGALEGRLERALERERELSAELERAKSVTPPPAAVSEDPGEPEEVPASWLMPVFTREFYDSLEGWDRRIQRAAFKQAALLAQDHRHPSLRALPLEGLPGYYRVRVATDVRLLYRRTDRQNTIEILSLIDREDLDRYIRQAKTRG